MLIAEDQTWSTIYFISEVQSEQPRPEERNAGVQHAEENRMRPARVPRRSPN